MKLKRHGVEATLDAHAGGRLASLRLDGREILVNSSDHPMTWGAYPMVPWAGRVRDGAFSWQGNLHRLPLDLPPHAIHGTVYNVPWTEAGDGVLVAGLGPDWPWSGRVQSTFELAENTFTWHLRVEATDVPMPVVLGWHPWFLRDLGDGPVELDFWAEKMYVRDEAGIPVGDPGSPSDGPWDDCFCEMTSNPELRWPCGLRLEVTSSCNHWVIYDMPEHALCVEPQSGPPDAFNRGGFEVAEPGAPVEHWMRLRWS